MFSLLYYCWYNFVTERITLDYTLRRYAAVLFRLVCVGFCGVFFVLVYVYGFFCCCFIFVLFCFVGVFFFVLLVFFLLFEVFLGGGVVFWRGGRYSTSMLYIVQQSAY